MANNELLKFPSDLNSKGNQPFIKLVALDWSVTKKRTVNVENISTISDTILLPLPQSSMPDELNISWQEEAGLEAQGISSVLKQAGLTAVKNLLGGVASKISFNRGQTLNDLASSTFENVEFRTHSFDWELIPTNGEDSETLRKIIQKFRQKSLSQKVSENILNYPAFWYIDVFAPNNTKLISYKLAVCTGISIDYMPNSIESFHSDGKPVQTNVGVQFKELFRVSRNDFK